MWFTYTIRLSTTLNFQQVKLSYQQKDTIKYSDKNCTSLKIAKRDIDIVKHISDEQTQKLKRLIFHTNKT